MSISIVIDIGSQADIWTMSVKMSVMCLDVSAVSVSVNSFVKVIHTTHSHGDMVLVSSTAFIQLCVVFLQATLTLTTLIWTLF
jgi:hypothetical protein